MSHQVPSLVLSGALVVAGLVGTILGVQYWRTAVEYRSAVEQTVRMRAAVLATRFAGDIQSLLYLSMEAAMAGAGDLSAVDAPAKLERAADSIIRCRCAPFFYPDWFFRGDLRTGNAVGLGTPHDSAQVRARMTGLGAALSRRARGRDRLISAGVDSRGPWLVVGRAVAHQGDSLFVGVEANLDSLRRQWDVLARNVPVPLIPSDTVGDLVGTELLLGDSTVIFRHGRVSEGQRETAKLSWGPLLARITIAPGAVHHFVLGGIPTLPIGPLVSLAVVGAAIIAIGLVFNARANALAAARAEFTAGVTHELRTPLTQILLFAETLALDRAQSAEERRGAALAIVRESRRLIDLVERVLRFAANQRSSVSLTVRPEPLGPLVTDIVRLAGPLAAAEGSRIDLVLEAAPTALVDQAAFRQVLGNLLDNAIRHGPPQQSVRVVLGEENGFASISVEDEGPGIPAEARDRIFEPYVRLPAARRSAGAGLGLSVVKHLVGVQGGRISVADSTRGGTTFRVSFPRVDEGTPPS